MEQSAIDDRFIELFTKTFCGKYQFEDSSKLHQIYWVPNNLHMHREIWAAEDVYILYDTDEHMIETISLEGSTGKNRLGNLYFIGVPDKNYESYLDRELSLGMYDLHSEEAREIRKLVNVYPIDISILERLEKLKAFY